MKCGCVCSLKGFVTSIVRPIVNQPFEVAVLFFGEKHSGLRFLLQLKTNANMPDCFENFFSYSGALGRLRVAW